MEIEGFEVWSQKRIFVKFQEKRAPLQLLDGENFGFQFLIKLQHSLYLRGLELWQ